MKSKATITAVMLCGLSAGTALAQLAFHYDPDTGNVSFDTSNTRNGSMMHFGLDLTYPVKCDPTLNWKAVVPGTRRGNNICDFNPTDVEFIPENYIHLSQSTIREVDENRVTETTFSGAWEGVYTLGNILPPNLDEQTWMSLFPAWGLTSFLVRAENATGYHLYSDVIGGGSAPPAEFVYGPPEGDFQNRWDLVDPDTLKWAEEAQLIYRQSTGELILDTSGETGGYSTIFQISSNDQFQPENFTPPQTSPFNSAVPDSVLVAGDAFEPGVYNLGSLLPVDLSLEEFSDSITAATFVGRAGFGTQIVALATDAIPLALRFEATPSVELCDLDGDGVCDITDMNLLYTTAGNDKVDPTRITQWLLAASSPDNLAKSSPSDVYTIGDIDLNGIIDSHDLGQLLNNFNDPSAGTWSQGNVNGASGVDSSDLGLLLNNISAAQVAAVPEPLALPLAFSLIIASLTLWRRKRLAPMR